MENEHILIVEDDPDLLQMMRIYLMNDGYRVDIASDGEESLRLWRSLRPDLLIVDWMLPGLSGLEIIKQVRALGTTPIII